MKASIAVLSPLRLSILSPLPHAPAASTTITSVTVGRYFSKSDCSLIAFAPESFCNSQDSEGGDGCARPSPLFNLPKKPRTCPKRNGKSRVIGQSPRKGRGCARVFTDRRREQRRRRSIRYPGGCQPGAVRRRLPSVERRSPAAAGSLSQSWQVTCLCFWSSPSQ